MGSKSARAYELIRQQISAGEFAPGDKLVLARLASLTGMSVVPIREAIRRLEAEGVVEFERNVGAKVASINTAQYFETMQTLAIVEAAATALAAPHTSDQQLAKARALNEQIAGEVLGSEAFDGGVYARLNREFHETIFQSCPNAQLKQLVEDGHARLQLVRDPEVSFSLVRARESVAEHQHILELIETGADPLEIERVVREHRSATSREALTH